MKRLVSKVNRYLRLYYYLVRANVMEIIIFRVNTLIMGLGPIIWMATMIIMAVTIFAKVTSLGGWSFWEVIFLTGVHELIFILTWSTFLINLRTFVNDVRTGKVDQFFLKPVSARFLISFRGLDFTNIGSFINVIVIFAFSFSKVVEEIIFNRIIGFMFFC
jgi:ABC-2 type transport system permease protein